MAYVPPHKRHSKDTGGRLPTPQLLEPQFKKILNLKSSSHGTTSGGKIIYAKQAISRWFAVGLDDNNQLPPSIQMEPISLESFERKSGEKPLILVMGTTSEDDKGKASRSPWTSIAEHVLEDLLSSFQNVKNEMEDRIFEEVKPTLVARFGKILFHGSYGGPSVNQETVRKSLASGAMSSQMRRSFYTNLPVSYIENISKEEISKIGLHFEEEKDIYHVKLLDATRPDSTISCKCSVMKEQMKLQFYKIELNQVRHMVTDISCLDKNLDLRLMLCSKRILTAMTDGEIQCIRDLIDSAVLDPNVKGGLRWPLGKSYSGEGDRFSVVGAWHTIAKSYKSPSMRMKVRHANRFDFRTSTGESTKEISLKLKGIVAELLVQKVETSLISKMLEDSLRIIWSHYLNCERFLA